MSEKTIELRGAESTLPVSVQTVKLDAYSVAKNIHHDKRGPTFRIDLEKLVARLEQLAQLIKAGEILPQRVTFSSTAEVDDWTLTKFELTFAEKVEPS